MKLKTLCIATLILSFASCNNAKKDGGGKSKDPEMVDVDAPIGDTAASATSTTPAKKITARDYSITKDNAYNDMLLDSLAMESYISSRQLGDKRISELIRSFYNARNYQYAWFSAKGLTEQARFFWNQYDYAVTHLKDTSLTNSAFF